MSLTFRCETGTLRSEALRDRAADQRRLDARRAIAAFISSIDAGLLRLPLNMPSSSFTD
jgi:hypothetical protein